MTSNGDRRDAVGRRLAVVAIPALVAVLALAIGAYRFVHDRGVWTSDGAIYLRMTLQARGLAPDAARREANAFMRTTDEARTPESRDFYTDSPPPFYRDQFDLLRTRAVYPAIAALLYPRFGPDALKLVSVAAYVAAVMLTFLLLLEVARPQIAAIGALVLGTAPPVLNVAALPLTDELALALWIAALAALVRYVRTRGFLALVALVAASAALAFVRPAIYLPLGAALGVLVGRARGSAEWFAGRTAAIAAAAVAASFVAYTWLVHGPGVVEQLRWEYAWQRAVHGPFASHSFIAWWLLAIAVTFALALVVEAYRHAALLVIVLAGFGLFAARRTVIAPVALGSAAATLIAIVANPVEVNRTVTLPLTPVVVLLATVALTELAAAVRRPARAASAAEAVASE